MDCHGLPWVLIYCGADDKWNAFKSWVINWVPARDMQLTIAQVHHK